MKYIRTKDKIYEIDKDISYGEKEIYKVRYHDFSIIGNGLQKADTIEELCDVFVTDVNRHIVWDKQQNKSITFELVKDSFPSYHFKIYGAIWTDKGLIYVAKMDEDGILRLI